MQFIRGYAKTRPKTPLSDVTRKAFGLSFVTSLQIFIQTFHAYWRTDYSKITFN